MRREVRRSRMKERSIRRVGHRKKSKDGLEGGRSKKKCRT